jgi:hypothetical protein
VALDPGGHEGRPYEHMLHRIVPIVVLLVFGVPAAALACPVCGTAGANDNGWAYFAMTIVLSGLPLGMMGGVGYWVYRHSAADAADAPASLPPDSPHD